MVQAALLPWRYFIGFIMTFNTFLADSQFDSRISGIQNTGPAQTVGPISIPSQVLAVGAQYVQSATFTILPTTKALMQIRVNLSQDGSTWRYFMGDTTIDYPGPPHYGVRLNYQRTGNNLTVYVVTSNLSAGGITTPAYTVNLAIAFYLPPWS